jgi:hypothetical protein
VSHTLLRIAAHFAFPFENWIVALFNAASLHSIDHTSYDKQDNLRLLRNICCALEGSGRYLFREATYMCCALRCVPRAIL